MEKENNEMSEPEELKISVSDQIKVSDGFIGHGKGKDLSEGIRTSDCEGRTISADTTPDGDVGFELRGKSAQGEENVLHVCCILVERKNRNGEKWGKPFKENVGDVDGLAKDLTDQKKLLKIQVTKGEHNRNFWKSLRNNEKVTLNSKIEEGAESLKNAISAKAKKLSPIQRGHLVLALDVTHTPFQVFEICINFFKKHFGEWTRDLGFREVWAVGPSADLTERLDPPEKH